MSNPTYELPYIEAPRRKQRGIFDPDKTCFICSLTPPQATGNALAGIQKNLLPQRNYPYP